MNLFNLTGRKAIVTGAAQGLGKAMAEGLHNAGAEVAIIDIRADVAEIAAAMAGTGAKVHGVMGDLTNREDLKRAFNQATACLGGTLDILVNNAGFVIRHFC
jgi:2-deoxy-D-gluconate 3-dehydrogenase